MQYFTIDVYKIVFFAKKGGRFFHFVLSYYVILLSGLVDFGDGLGSFKIILYCYCRKS